MTRKLLHISASPRGAGSQSRRIGAQFVERLLQGGDLAVIRRDLGAEPPPPLSAKKKHAKQQRGKAR